MKEACNRCYLQETLLQKNTKWHLKKQLKCSIHEATTSATFIMHLIFNPETRWPFSTKTLLETLLVIWKYKITTIKLYSVKWVSCMNIRTSLCSILAPYLLLVSNTPFNYFKSTSKRMLNDWHLVGCPLDFSGDY